MYIMVSNISQARAAFSLLRSWLQSSKVESTCTRQAQAALFITHLLLKNLKMKNSEDKILSF